jgi:predicted permease
MGMFDGIWQDLRHAARTAGATPLITISAALSLAIGIAGAAVIFSFVDAYFVRPWPGVPDPGRLVEIGRVDSGVGPGPSTGDGFSTFSYPNYADYRARQTVFRELAASRTGVSIGLGDGVVAQRVTGAYVSANYFRVVGVPIALGRGFLPEDEQLSAAASVVVISDRLWRTQFGGERSAIGRTIRLNGRAFTLVGVAAPGFRGHAIDVNHLWVPLGTFDVVDVARLARRDQQWLMGLGRLRDGVTLDQARADMTRIARDLAREYPTDNRRHGLAVEPAGAIPVDGRSVIGRFVTLLSALIALVLIVACANVGAMLLARGVSRSREIAVRLALGAERRRVARLLVIESLVVAGGGAVAGLLGAWAAIRLLERLLPVLRIDITYALAIDSRVMTFVAVVAAVTGIVCGWVPALQAIGIDLSSAMKPTSGSSPRRLRARQLLLVAQVAVSVLLTVCALLLGRSLRNADAIDPGFVLSGVEAVGIDLKLGGFTPETQPQFVQSLMSRVQALPGVETAALARLVPLTREREGGRVWLPEKPRDEDVITVSRNFVTPDYFKVLQIPLVGGRNFDESDRMGAPLVAIINETLARRAFPGQDAVGRYFAVGPNRRPMQIVGVARDTKYRTIGEEANPFVYIPAAQTNEAIMWLLVRSTGASLLPHIRTLVAEMNPNLPLMLTSSLEDLTAIVLWPHRLASWLAAVVAIIGVVLAAIGIYGLTAYNVSQRTREIGVRVALGAVRLQVVRSVVSGVVLLAGIGAALGLIAAALVTGMLAGMLYGVQPIDLTSFSGGAATFIAVAAVASLVPARRAASINPVDALRAE